MSNRGKKRWCKGSHSGGAPNKNLGRQPGRYSRANSKFPAREKLRSGINVLKTPVNKSYKKGPT